MKLREIKITCYYRGTVPTSQLEAAIKSALRDIEDVEPSQMNVEDTEVQIDNIERVQAHATRTTD